MAYTSSLPTPVPPSAPRPLINGLMTPQGQVQPQQNGIQGVLSQLGSNLTSPMGPEHAISTQMFANAFTSGRDDRNMMSGVPEAAQARQIGIIRQQEAQAAEEERAVAAEEANKTAEWIKTNFPQYANLPIDQGFQLAVSDMQRQKQGMDPTSAMQEYQFAQGQGYDGTFADWKGGGAATGRDAPSGYQWGPDGTSMTFVPGGPADPANKSSNVPMNSTIQKEIFEADEGAMAGQSVVQSLTRALELNDQAWSGPVADPASYAGSLIGNEGATATQELKNLVTAQALDQLKVTFGSMPTEGERKILLEIQGSVNQAPEVRRVIFERALAAAQRRIIANQQKAEALRGGTYFDPGFGAGGQPAAQQPGGTTAGGLQWSVE